MAPKPFVYRGGKVLFYYRPQEGEVQEYYDGDIPYGPDPDKYIYADGTVTPVSKEVAAQMDAAVHEVLDKQQEVDESIATAKVTSNLKDITVEQAETFIGNLLDVANLADKITPLQSADTIPELRAAVISTFTEIYQHLIKNKDLHNMELPYILK